MQYKTALEQGQSLVAVRLVRTFIRYSEQRVQVAVVLAQLGHFRFELRCFIVFHSYELLIDKEQTVRTCLRGPHLCHAIDELVREL